MDVQPCLICRVAGPLKKMPRELQNIKPVSNMHRLKVQANFNLQSILMTK